MICILPLNIPLPGAVAVALSSLYFWRTALLGKIFLVGTFVFLPALCPYHPIHSWPTEFLLRNPLRTYRCSLVCKIFFFCWCFQDSLSIFDFWQFDYNVVLFLLYWIWLETFELPVPGCLCLSPDLENFPPLFL